MTNAVLDEFGRKLIQEVRDESISDWEMILDGRMRSERAEGLRNMIPEQCRESFKSTCPEVVNTVLHHLLRWLEEDDAFKISCASKEIDDLSDESDGFCGELYTSEGWISRFSEYP